MAAGAKSRRSSFHPEDHPGSPRDQNEGSPASRVAMRRAFAHGGLRRAPARPRFMPGPHRQFLGHTLPAHRRRRLGTPRGAARLAWNRSRHSYKESRLVGYDVPTLGDKERDQRAQRISEGKLSAEDFDKSFNETPKAFYAQ